MNEQQEQQPNSEAPKPKTLIAVLDATGVFLGTREIDVDALGEGDVHLPEGCDLPPGEYRWDFAQRTFLPLMEPVALKVEEPHALNAIAAGFVSLWGQGITLPAVTLGWLDFYTRSIDFSDAAMSDPQLYETCRRFANRNKGA